MKQIKLYTIGCPKCTVLEKKLKAANIPYEAITDTAAMLAKGLSIMPVLEVDGETLDFAKAVEWINKQ